MWALPWALPPLALRAMTIASLQGTALAALSNILAQLIDPWRKSEAVSFHIADFVRFVAASGALQPPLFYWQMWMEVNWPGMYVPTKSGQDYVAVAQDFEMGEWDVDEHQVRGPTPNPNVVEDAGEDGLRASGRGAGGGLVTSTKKGMIWKNVWIKWGLDNTFGGLWFTVGFIVFIELFKFNGMAAVWHGVLRDTLALLLPSYIVWAPATLFNFIWIPAEKRIVFLGFVAVLWGIYLSLFTAESSDLGTASKSPGKHLG